MPTAGVERSLRLSIALAVISSVLIKHVRKHVVLLFSVLNGKYWCPVGKGCADWLPGAYILVGRQKRHYSS